MNQALSPRYAGRNIWIVGAGSGIGRALAVRLAREGATLFLSGRNASALEETAALCAGAVSPGVHVCDITDPEAVERTAFSVIEEFGADTVVVLAALSRPDRYAPLHSSEIIALNAVNLTGVHLAAEAVYRRFCGRPAGGMLVLCASAAGYIGMPYGRPYCCAKAGVISLAESMSAEAPEGVAVKLINPGFVRTRITAGNDFPMPCLIDSETAAAAIADGLLRGGFEIAFPRRFVFVLKLFRLLPYFLLIPLLRHGARQYRARRGEDLR